MAAKPTKKKKSTRGRPKKEQQNQEIRGEIIILIALAVCILLVLSNFGMGGIVGEAVSSVFFGLFGIMAYVLPFAAFGISAFLVSNRGNAHAYIKIGAAVVLFLLLTAVFGLIFDQYKPGISLLTYYHTIQYSSECGRSDRRMCCQSLLSADRGNRNICSPVCALYYLCDSDYREVSSGHLLAGKAKRLTRMRKRKDRRRLQSGKSTGKRKESRKRKNRRKKEITGKRISAGIIK